MYHVFGWQGSSFSIHWQVFQVRPGCFCARHGKLAECFCSFTFGARNGEREEKGSQDWARKALEVADGLLSSLESRCFALFLELIGYQMSLQMLLQMLSIRFGHSSGSRGCWLRTHAGQILTIGGHAAWFVCSSVKRHVKLWRWHSFAPRSPVFTHGAQISQA